MGKYFIDQSQFVSFFLCSSASHLTSLYRALMETSLVVPVAMRAASSCIVSICCFSYCAQLSHMTSPYSSRDRIMSL